MRIFLLITLLILSRLASGQQKQVCFTYDDMPVVNYGITDPEYQKNMINKLVRSLKINNIPAIGFVNEKKLYDEYGNVIPFQAEMLRSWVNNGLDLGNHTYAHPDYNTVSFEKYAAGILQGEIITKEILNGKGKSIKYFRHPFLHVGKTRAKADSLDAFLTNHGYTVAPVTIDNEDYLFALAYKRAKVKRDTLLANQIGHDFVNYMERKLKYFEKQANILFGRDISQILLLHASLLNSDYTDSIAFIFRKHNYDFVSMDKALEDKAYRTPITVYGTWGISWIDKWALSQGKKGDFFKEDPETPEYIRKLAE